MPIEPDHFDCFDCFDCPVNYLEIDLPAMILSHLTSDSQAEHSAQGSIFFIERELA